jgi:hydrogenase-4 component F
MNGVGAQFLIWLVLFGPVAASGLCALPRSPRGVLLALSLVVAGYAGGCAALAWNVFRFGAVVAANDWLRLDALSALHLVLLAFVFLTSTLFARRYFVVALPSLRKTRLFAVLWLASMAAMTLVLVANHLGIMWVGVESTTLMTTFLIAFHRSRESLEATWKYLMICSVGIAIAFLGMLILGASGSQAAGPGADPMLWTTLRDVAPRLDAKLAKLGFIFLLVGYGTKVGLAPMHTWLPDAHSQAPAPVSSIFSAAMLSTVLYCLMRYLPVVESATGGVGWSSRLLCLFGALSMVISAAFVLFQRDVKRMLAYCSVEHMGIVAIGLGLGNLGTFAALFHTINHALAKSTGFMAAGRVGQMAGTHQMWRLRGIVRVSPLWGTTLCLSLLSLIGVVPSAIFASELMVVKAALDARAIPTLIAFLLATGTVFLGMFAHTMGMLRGEPDADCKSVRPGASEALVAVLPMIALALLGVWMPTPLRHALAEAAMIVRPTP